MGGTALLTRPGGTREDDAELEVSVNSVEQRLPERSYGTTAVKSADVVAGFSTVGEVLSEAPIKNPFWERPKSEAVLAIEASQARELRVRAVMVEMRRKLGAVGTEKTVSKRTRSRRRQF